jgi:hypothetical protein
MPQLSISKTYADGTTLFESDLDNIKDGLETFINTTKLDGENIQDSAIVEAKKLFDMVMSPEAVKGYKGGEFLGAQIFRDNLKM